MGSFFVKIWVFDHPGRPYIGLPPMFCRLFWTNTIMLCPECILRLRFIIKCFRMEDIFLIPIFWVIFCQNFGIWPLGVPMYRVTLHYSDFNFEEIASPLNVNVFFYIFERSKWNNTGILAFCCQKLGVWQPRVPIRGLTLWDFHIFKFNLGWGWFFMFKLTKRPKHMQNMVQTWKF